MPVLNIFLLYDRIIIVQEKFIFNFVLTDLTYESSIETYDNKKGICEVCSSPTDPIPTVVAFPGGLNMNKHRVGFTFANNNCIVLFPLPILEVLDEDGRVKMEDLQKIIHQEDIDAYEKKEHAHTGEISALAV